MEGAKCRISKDFAYADEMPDHAPYLHKPDIPYPHKPHSPYPEKKPNDRYYLRGGGKPDFPHEDTKYDVAVSHDGYGAESSFQEGYNIGFFDANNIYGPSGVSLEGGVLLRRDGDLKIILVHPNEHGIGLIYPIQEFQFGFLQYTRQGKPIEIDPSELYGLKGVPRASVKLLPIKDPGFLHLRKAPCLVHGRVSIYDRHGEPSVVSYYISGLDPGTYSLRTSAKIAFTNENLRGSKDSSGRPKGEIGIIVAARSGIAAGFFYTDYLRLKGPYACVEDIMVLYSHKEALASGPIVLASCTE